MKFFYRVFYTNVARYKRRLETQLLLTYDFHDICYKNNSPVFLLTCQIRSHSNNKKIQKEVFQIIAKTIECTQIAFSLERILW